MERASIIVQAVPPIGDRQDDPLAPTPGRLDYIERLPQKRLHAFVRFIRIRFARYPAVEEIEKDILINLRDLRRALEGFEAVTRVHLVDGAHNDWIFLREISKTH